MTHPQPGIARRANEAPARTGSAYPSRFAARVAGRIKQPLGDLFGLDAFGVNLVTLPPGCQSSLRHRHRVQDEFIYIVSGHATLAHDDGEESLVAGMCAGFRHDGTAHHLINRSDAPVVYLEVGDRQSGDTAEFPDDDLVAAHDGHRWRYTRTNGEAY